MILAVECAEQRRRSGIRGPRRSARSSRAIRTSRGCVAASIASRRKRRTTRTSRGGRTSRAITLKRSCPHFLRTRAFASRRADSRSPSGLRWDLSFARWRRPIPCCSFPRNSPAFARAQDDALHLEGDQFVSADGRHGVLFVGTRPAPFDGEGQTRLLASIDAAFGRINREAQGTLRLESSGVNRFDVSVEKGIRADIQRISLVSTMGVVVLFLVVFRSIRYVALGIVPLLAGTICAMAAGIALFGSLHGLTLAFGSSLIGVGIDYAEHYFSHHTVSPDPAGPDASLRRIWPGLAIGALTTVAGLAGLAWTSFPGLREIAVFSSVGVVASLLATRWFLPPLMPRHPKPVALQQRLVRLFGRMMIAMMRARRAMLLLPLAGALVCAIGLPSIRWVDDLSALNAFDPALVAEDQRVRQLATEADPGRFVVVIGRSDEEALARNDDVARRLGTARADGVLKGFSSVHSLLWSSGLQARARAMLTQDTALAGRLAKAYESEGFVPSAFEPFAEELRSTSKGPLTPEDLLGSPLGDLLRPFRVVLGNQVALVTSVAGVHDANALTARLEGLPDVFFFDQRAFSGRSLWAISSAHAADDRCRPDRRVPHRARALSTHSSEPGRFLAGRPRRRNDGGRACPARRPPQLASPRRHPPRSQYGRRLRHLRGREP